MAEAEAVARANHTEFGLSASVWTRDGARALRVARALRDGTVWINDHNKLFAEAETGGYRKSGLGRLHGGRQLAVIASQHDALAAACDDGHEGGGLGGLRDLVHKDGLERAEPRELKSQHCTPRRADAQPDAFND